VTIAARPIAVTIARFEDIVAVGLRSLIEGDDTLSLVAADVDHELIGDALARQRPDVAILNFASLQSPTELRDLAAEHPDTRLLVLANNPSSTECRQMIGFGATACLAQSSEARDVLHAIHLASRGMHVLPGPAEGETAAEPAGPTPLTPRETEVLELLQGGRSNAEIAADLQLGVETVRTHARHIYRKLGVSTRRELRPSL
jgi:DNA-binding NarL/FixJ family response regulator